jgi:Rrf2 family protein
VTCVYARGVRNGRVRFRCTTLQYLAPSTWRTNVKISAKTEYACIAMLELAGSFGSDDPVRIRHIAAEHAIPSRFLVQILLQLKGAGFVTSVRGASGGYQLSRAPSDITLGEVMSVIEGQDDGPASSASPDSRAARVLQAVWRKLSITERQILNSITFADLHEKTLVPTEGMYYI